jgi:hypothetical protein
MAQVNFTPNLRRHLSVPQTEVPGASVREALEVVFERNPQLRSYVVDDQGRLRKHVVVFIDGEMIEDREGLSDAINASSELFVMQALSGG